MLTQQKYIMSLINRCILGVKNMKQYILPFKIFMKGIELQLVSFMKLQALQQVLITNGLSVKKAKISYSIKNYYLSYKQHSKKEMVF